MIKKILLAFVSLVVAIACAACSDVGDTEVNRGYTYTLSENYIPLGWNEISLHQFHVLNNGYIVRKQKSIKAGESQYYFQDIIDKNGIEYKPQQPYAYRVVVETDEGNIITATRSGETVVYDKNWNAIDTVNDFYYAAPLDGGRYFAVNDTEYVEIEGGFPSYYDPRDIYALYRYTEKLTECKYISIIPCEGGFECIYLDENDSRKSDFIYVDDKVPLPEPEIEPARNEKTGKYYFADRSGNKILEDEFDYISNVANNRAVVLIEDRFYILDLSCAVADDNDTTDTTDTTDTSANVTVDDTTAESGNTENVTDADTSQNDDASLEPPLSEYELTMSVPEFLDEEQQMLYRKACNVYSHVFGSSTSFVEYEETLDYPLENYESFQNESGWRYMISQGRYQNWDDFTALVYSVFTEDFFNHKNSSARFIECYGKLTYVDADKGGVVYYNSNFNDKFKLVLKSDTEIVFELIAHYSEPYPLDGESYEERDARRNSEWEWTDKFTIRMVLTDAGWRFDEFYNPAIDEPAEDGEEIDIIGKFVCASDYHRCEYFISHTALIPSISFFEDGKCSLLVNYLEGCSDVDGEYYTDGNTIHIKMYLDGTVFENTGTEYPEKYFMDDTYSFEISDNNTLTIDRGFYTVHSGDMFVRVTEIPSEELFKRVLNGTVRYEDAPIYTAFRNDVEEKMAEFFGGDIDWYDTSVYIRDNPRDERYPYAVLLSDNSAYDLVLEAGVVAAQIDGEVEYCLEWSYPYHVYGKYVFGDEIIDVNSDEDTYACINKTRLLKALDSRPDMEGYTVEYGSITLCDGIISVPIHVGNANVLAKVRVNDDLSYTMLSVEKGDGGDQFDVGEGLTFSFVRNGGMFYLILGDNGEITLPDTEAELFVLMLDGCFVPMLPEKDGEGVLIPKAAFDAMNIDIENDAEYLTLDEISEMGFEVDIVCMDANAVLNYELNAVVIETSNDEAKYSIDEAQGIIYDRLRAGYDGLLSQIDSGELLQTHSEGNIARILNDAAEFTVSSVSFREDFGRYYVFTTTVFGAEIYFDRYTGEIFSDAPVIEMATIDIGRGLYDLSRAYW